MQLVSIATNSLHPTHSLHPTNSLHPTQLDNCEATGMNYLTDNPGKWWVGGDHIEIHFVPLMARKTQ